MDFSYINYALPRVVAPQVASNILFQLRNNQWNSPGALVAEGYAAMQTKDRGHNGTLFEALFFAGMLGAGIRNWITSAQYTILPYSKVDVVIYTRQSGPVMISLKSSLRERWKQSDLEFGVVKRHQANAHCVIATMDTQGCDYPKRLLLNQRLLGLDEVIDCNYYSQVVSLFEKILHFSPETRVKDTVLGLTNFKEFSV